MKFREDFTNRFYRTSPASQTAYKLSLEKIIALADIHKTDKVIDLGCGSGELLREVGKISKNILGVDNSPGMLIQARKDNPGIKIIYGDTLFLKKIKNESFDVVLSRAVFQHLSKREHKKFLDETLRILKPGGKFVMFTPIDSIPMRFPRLVSKIMVKERRKFSGILYPDAYIRETVIKAGFILDKVEYYGLFFYILSGYGTEFYLPFHKDRRLWKKLFIVDDLLMRMPGMKFFALNGTYKTVKHI